MAIPPRIFFVHEYWKWRKRGCEAEIMSRRLLRFHDGGLTSDEFYGIDHLARIVGEMQGFTAVDILFLAGDEFT